MLVLSRKRGEIIDLPELGVSFKIIDFKSAGIVSVGIEAPANIRVHRREILEKIEAQENDTPAAETEPVQPAPLWAKKQRRNKKENNKEGQRS
jgi:carbon storage regulator CsrA